MKAKLVVVGGDAKAAEITLKLPTVIGRGRGSKLVLPHPLVSRRHCEIFESGGQLVVRDLGSLNGTFIGNERVEERGEAVLPPGELLTIGAVTFRAVYGEGNGEAVQGAEGVGIPGLPVPGAKTVRASHAGTVRVHAGDNGAAAIDAEGDEMDESAAANDDDNFDPFADGAFEEFEEDDSYDVDSTESIDMEEDFDSDETGPAPAPPKQAPPIAPPQSAAESPIADSDDDALNSFLGGLK